MHWFNNKTRNKMNHENEDKNFCDNWKRVR